MTFSKLKHGRAGFPMCMSLLACGGVEPVKTPKETEDTVEDEEKNGQIIWCFICMGRSNKKGPTPRIYVQLAGTHPLKDTVFV